MTTFTCIGFGANTLSPSLSLSLFLSLHAITKPNPWTISTTEEITEHQNDELITLILARFLFLVPTTAQQMSFKTENDNDLACFGTNTVDLHKQY